MLSPMTHEADLGLLDALVQLSFAIQAALARVADAHELSLVQLRLLGILRDREPGMMEVATFLNMSEADRTKLSLLASQIVLGI
jgi:hypothetical protein